MTLLTRLRALERRAGDGIGSGRVSMTADELEAHFQKWLGYAPGEAGLRCLTSRSPADLTTDELRAIARIKIDFDDARPGHADVRLKSKPQ